MSSILEALKKSEAQRAATAAGQPQAAPQQYRASPSRRQLGLLLALALLLAIAVLWRFELLPGASRSAGEAAFATAPVPAPNSTQDPAPKPAPDQLAEAQSSANPERPGATAAKARDDNGSAEKPLERTKPADDAAGNALPAAPLSAVEAALVDAPAAQSVAVQNAPGPAAEPAPARRAPAAASAAEPDSNGNAPARPGSRLPALSQLPSLEQEIGAVAMTMLVFSQDPARRFALVNGQRMVEGDSLDGGIELLEIRRNECVFAARGQRFVVRSQ